MNLFLLILSEAWKSLNAYRMRSFLTMLGVIIGVWAVVLVLAVGEGMRERVQRSIKSLGSNVLTITPGAVKASGVKSAAGEMVSLTLEDAEAIRELPTVGAVAPIANGAGQIIAGAQNWNTGITGSTPDIITVREYKITDGEMFSDADVRTAARVIVLGQTVADNLFPGGQAVGGIVRVKNLTMRVVGVLKGSGQSMGGHDQDDMAIVPITTAQRQLFGSLLHDNIRQITATAKSTRLVDATQRAITDLLRERKHVSPDDELPFTVGSLASIMEAMKENSRALSLFLAAAGSISLVVGGIGIMNIMLVSVSERTREIGICKAIGASQLVILAQFLTEAVALSLSGCFIGIALGFASNRAVANMTKIDTHISLSSVLVSVTVAALIGVVFGFFPALKAARLSPAEALRV